MRVHDYFEADGKFYLNAVTDYFGALGTGRPFGAYMKIGSLVKKARIAEYNADIMEGPLYAVFTASLEPGERAAGECGLSPYEDGSLLMNRTVIEESEAESVSAAVFLETEGEAQFCGGENPLVRMLLGLDGFGDSAGPNGWEILAGDNYFGNEPIYFEPPQSNVRWPAAAKITAGGLELSGEIIGQEPREIVFTYGRAAALRWFCTAYAKVTSHTKTADSRGDVKVPGNVVAVDIFNVTAGGVPVSCVVADVPRQMGKRRIIRFRLGENPRFVCDADGRYMAVATETDVTLLTLSGDEAVIAARLARNGERVLVTSNGAIGFLGRELRIYEPETEYSESGCKVYPFADAAQAALVWERGRYQLACYDGTTLVRYALGEGAEELGRVTAPDLRVFAADKRSIGYVSPAGVYGCKTIDSFDATTEETLLSLMTDFGTVTELWADQGVMVMRADGTRYGLNIYEIGGEELMEGPLIEGSGGTYAIEYQGKTILSVRSITEEGIGELDTVEGTDFVTMGRLGRYVVVARADGTCESFYMKGSTKYAHSDSIAGKSVSFTARELENVRDKYRGFRFKVRLDMAAG